MGITIGEDLVNCLYKKWAGKSRMANIHIRIILTSTKFEICNNSDSVLCVYRVLCNTSWKPGIHNQKKNGTHKKLILKEVKSHERNGSFVLQEFMYCLQVYLASLTDF